MSKFSYFHSALSASFLKSNRSFMRTLNKSIKYSWLCILLFCPYRKILFIKWKKLKIMTKMNAQKHRKQFTGNVSIRFFLVYAIERGQRSRWIVYHASVCVISHICVVWCMCETKFKVTKNYLNVHKQLAFRKFIYLYFIYCNQTIVLHQNENYLDQS